MNVTIKTIPHDQHRYETVGDYWWTTEGDLEIRVSDMGDWRMSMMVAIHELVESLLCEARGLKEPDIMAFDLTVPDDPDPGFHPDAPYGKEHTIATSVEMMLCSQFGIPWREYEAAVEAL